MKGPRSLSNSIGAGLFALAVIPILLVAATTGMRLDASIDKTLRDSLSSITEAMSDLAVRYRLDAEAALDAMDRFPATDALADFLSRGGVSSVEIRAFARLSGEGALTLAWPPQEAPLSSLLASSPGVLPPPMTEKAFFSGPVSDGQGGNLIVASRVLQLPGGAGRTFSLVALDADRIRGYFGRLRMEGGDVLALVDEWGAVLAQSQNPGLPLPSAGRGGRELVPGKISHLDTGKARYSVLALQVPRSPWLVAYYSDEATLMPFYRSLLFRVLITAVVAGLSALFAGLLVRRELKEPFTGHTRQDERGGGRRL